MTFADNATLSSSPELDGPSVDVSPAPIDLRSLGREVSDALRCRSSEADVVAEFTDVARRVTRARAILFFGLDSTEKLGANPVCTHPVDLRNADVDRLFALALQTQASESCQLFKTDTSLVVGVPVFLHDGNVEALIVLADVDPGDQKRIAGLLQLLQLLAVSLGQVRGRTVERMAARSTSRLQSLIDAEDMANRSDRFQQGAEKLANYLAQRFTARRVALGLKKGPSRCRVVAVSNETPLVSGAPLVGDIETAMSESLLDPTLSTIAQDSPAQPGTTAVRQLFRHFEAESICRVRLADASNRPFAVVLLIRDASLSERELNELGEVSQHLGPYLDRLKRSQSGWIRRVRAAYRELPGRSRRVILGLSLLAAFLLFVLPIPYKVRCRCDVQPVTRRYIAAPYEGRLQDALVQPGDYVTEGQVLAVMDGREIRLELAGLNAELQRVTKQRDRALANRETAAAQIALLETQRLQSNMQLLEDRLRVLEIRSPTDGVVISGDPRKMKGARLSLGQTLFEIGPLGEMVLELAVPDENIRQVRPPATVRFRLDSMPHRRFRGHVRRVYPRSELRDASNVFIADVAIEDQTGELRPGMRGRASISAGRRSLFWIGFHRALYRIAFALGL